MPYIEKVSAAIAYTSVYAKIYFYRSAADVVYFLDIYAKAAKEDLTPADKEQLKELVNRLKGVQ
jgi:hypothetical protein